MQYLSNLLNNRILLTALLAMLSSQVIKFLLYLIINRKFDISRILGDGGMPSSHSSVVSSVATFCALCYGLDSFEFSITVLLAFIVMHDAKGVRLETGKQAKVLNELMDVIINIKGLAVDFSYDKFEEFVGHTPLQVLFGAILGIFIGFISYNFIF